MAGIGGNIAIEGIPWNRGKNLDLGINGLPKSAPPQSVVVRGRDVFPSMKNNEKKENVSLDEHAQTVQQTMNGGFDCFSGGVAETLLSGTLKSNISFEDAQKLVDHAMSKTGSVMSHSKNASNEILKNAVEKVARSNNDESVRSAARNFMNSLNRIHLSSRDESRNVSSAVSAMSTVVQNEGADISTVVDESIHVMKNALSQYQSPESALEAMYKNGHSHNLGSVVHEKERSNVSTADSFGPVTIRSARELNSDFFSTAGRDLNKTHNDYLSKIPEGDVILDEPELHGDPRSFVERKADVVNANHLDRSEIAFESGLLLISQDAYHQEANDKFFALRNALFGAIGYRSGSQIQEKLREYAESNPKIRSFIEELGESTRTKLNENDWKSMVELAREIK